MIEHHLFQLLINFFLFSEDDISFSLNGCRIEFRVLENIGEDVNGLGNVGVERFGVVDSVFALENQVSYSCGQSNSACLPMYKH